MGASLTADQSHLGCSLQPAVPGAALNAAAGARICGDQSQDASGLPAQAEGDAAVLQAGQRTCSQTAAATLLLCLQPNDQVRDWMAACCRDDRFKALTC